MEPASPVVWRFRRLECQFLCAVCPGRLAIEGCHERVPGTAVLCQRIQTSLTRWQTPPAAGAACAEICRNFGDGCVSVCASGGLLCVLVIRHLSLEALSLKRCGLGWCRQPALLHGSMRADQVIEMHARLANFVCGLGYLCSRAGEVRV